MGVTELTGLSGLRLMFWPFPFPLFTGASTAAVYPTMAHHMHTDTNISLQKGVAGVKPPQGCMLGVCPGTQQFIIFLEGNKPMGVQEREGEREGGVCIHVGRELCFSLSVQGKPVRVMDEMPLYCIVYTHTRCLTV